ncbi:unnamed protein product [Schistosoma margrebowiei]|uniref:Uncharacterized protein n=1 Tax=Schistosoma margrebowiei TaxID=48269 RepID=A0A183N5G7_9TREM|nr:unnamed protein product [Schistosoma margrebowiei]
MVSRGCSVTINDFHVLSSSNFLFSFVSKYITFRYFSCTSKVQGLAYLALGILQIILYFYRFLYSGHTCELYLVSRLAPNFATVCRVLYEIRKRCPSFIPKSLFDFGSGGIALLMIPGRVSNRVLLNRIKYSVDTHLRDQQAGFRKDRSKNTNKIILLFRRFHFSFIKKNQYNLVVCANSLLEIPCKSSRSRVISSLWEKTTDFLVFIEQGTKSGFQAILEARDFLVCQFDFLNSPSSSYSSFSYLLLVSDVMCS